MLAYKEGFTELLLEGEAGKWYFKYGNGYIYAKSTTSTVLSFDTNKKKSANISISNGNASIGFDIPLNSSYLSYSTKTSNFGYYNSIFGDHGVPVQIYKKQRRANGLSISTKSFTTTTADLEGNFHSYVTLTNPNNLSPITYKSSNTGVAEVNEQGDVKVNKSGETTITVSYAGNDTYTQAELSYTLTINKLENGITIDKTSVAADLNGYKGEAKQYVSLTNPNNLPITYTSSNPYVATVDESGNVKLVSWGKTTITVSYTGSEVYKSATTSYELNVINSLLSR